MPVHPKRRRNAKHELIHFLRKRGGRLLHMREHGINNALPFSDSVSWTRAGTKTTIRDGKVWDLASGAADHGGWVEVGATNLFVYSADQSQANYGKDGVTVTTDAVAAPNGVTEADQLVEDTTTGFHSIFQQETGLGASTQYTFSCFAKYVDRQWVSLLLSGGAWASEEQYFDIQNGVLGTANNSPDDAKIERLNDGWFRLSLTATSTPGGIGNFNFSIAEADNDRTYTGDNASSVYIWGYQLETGPYATSHIPTTTANVTRIKDDARALDVLAAKTCATHIVRWWQPTANVTDLPGANPTIYEHLIRTGPSEQNRCIASGNAWQIQILDAGANITGSPQNHTATGKGYHTLIMSLKSGNSFSMIDSEVKTYSGTFTWDDTGTQANDIYIGQDGSLTRQCGCRVLCHIYIPNYSLTKDEAETVKGLLEGAVN